ncbi:MAG: methionine biosynthesis protein MetW [Azoarcus sp.]|nr:methionine biosynthesis protein MetW [Azoarcus sp.]
MSVPFDQTYASEQLRRQRSPLRRAIKRFYLQSALSETRGPTIDLGCGAGQLLEHLPPGSVGIEVNPVLAEDLLNRGLNVVLADPTAQGFGLREFAPSRYRSLIMSHVLEHFDNASEVLSAILDEAAGLALERVVIIVPGWKGYLTDATHRTFVDRSMLVRCELTHHAGYSLVTERYFPINTEAAGRWHPFNESVFVWQADVTSRRPKA